ncbi:MBL fold metallo-hydrolase [Pedobacter frigiditerrae]|uniref:MBL fold metallo-hydrolase n=1 Tax=Pedobacter frigiditerrae TaxID=2530452 RepID=UPI00292D7105|nr:MBL fold metallo-hydrolase [Pedobacter frigiditerrae]
MKIEQLYEKCLSQASYFIEHYGIAAIIDPIRDIDRYLELAETSGAKIKYIFETHFHADFVSGHIELAEITGAEIIFGPGAQTSFASTVVQDGTTFNLGDHSLTLLHTPGHTLESSCYLLKDEQSLELALFTGDTLFLGDVGRPDLAQDTTKQLSQEDLAGKLYDSLHTQILPLPNHVIIYPGHGAGSACGKNMSNEKSGDLGSQRNFNYALDKDLSKVDFIKLLCNELPPPPAYFPYNVKLNIEGYRPLKQVLANGLASLTPWEFVKRMDLDGTLVLDTRSAVNFSQSHITGSINIGLEGSFAPFVGAIIQNTQQEILLVCDSGKEAEAITRLARIGYHQCTGYLEGGIKNWMENGYPFDVVNNITAKEFNSFHISNSQQIIDVRNTSEFLLGNVPGAINIPLTAQIVAPEIYFSTKESFVYCAGGYRSMIFISLLKAKGIHSVVNVIGGYNTIKMEENLA